MKNQWKILAFWGKPVIFLLSLLVKQKNRPKHAAASDAAASVDAAG